jgi:L-fuconolactonase
MLIDSHQHFWDPALGSYPWMTDELASIRRPFGPADLWPLLDRSGVERSVVVQARTDSEETRWLLALAEENEFVAGVVGWVDLTESGVEAQIAGLRSAPGGEKLVGIRHQVHDEADPEWLMRPDVAAGLEAVSREGLVYDLLVRSRELPAAFHVVSAFPELRFVIDHVAKPPVGTGEDQAWFTWMSRLAGLANVSVKVSGLVTEADWAAWTSSDFQPYVQAAIELFGAERLLFGSDWPVCLLAARYEQVLDLAGELLASLSDSERRLVFGENAVRLYGLGQASPPVPSSS